MHSSARRSSCFIAGDDDDDEDAAAAEASFSFSSAASLHRSHGMIPIPTLRSFNSGVLSPRFGRMYEARFDDRQPYFLQTCAYCKKAIGDHMDIFMYRGDTPFCSEECRQEQIDIDDAKEKKLKMSSSVKSSQSANKAEKYSIRTSTVAAA
uniref:FLZ-type domain-containing protein n=1 Tax=Kalanchoe fedtschenkoi TaxID=63787 RepID=A0A7N0UTU7_KALFE